MRPALIQALNAVGVVALTGLTLVQWRDNAALRTAVETATRSAAAATAESAARARDLDTAKADLDDFRARLTRAETTRRQLETEIATLTRDLAASSTQVASLKENLERWQSAVTTRDTRIAEYATALKDAQTAHADAVARHNALAIRHNALAARFTRLTDALGPDAAPVRLTREAIPTPTHITEPGRPRRTLAPEEAAAIVAALVGRSGHTYPAAYAAPADAPPPTLIEGEAFRLLRFPDNSARFERADLRIHLPATTSGASE